MLRTLVFAVLSVLVFTSSSLAGPRRVYGVGSLRIPTEQEQKYEWDRLRFGLDLPMSAGVDGHLLIDVSKNAADLKLGYVGVQRGDFTANLGKWLAPAQFCFDPAGTIQLPDWSYSNRHLTAFGQGARIDYKTGPLFASVGHHNNAKDTSLSGIVTLKGEQYRCSVVRRSVALSFYGEAQVGYGVYLRTKMAPYFNPSIGGSAYVESVKRGTAEGEQYLFVQNYAQILRGLRLYGQYDWTNRDTLPDRGLVGLAWEYAPNSFARLYYDTAAEEVLPSVSFMFAL